MEKLVLKKVVTLVGALALGSACIANDALAKDDIANDALAKDDGGVHHFVGSVRDNGLDGRPAWAMTLRPASLGGPETHGYNCWKSEGIPTNPAWRQRHAGDKTC